MHWAKIFFVSTYPASSAGWLGMSPVGRIVSFGYDRNHDSLPMPLNTFSVSSNQNQIFDRYPGTYDTLRHWMMLLWPTQLHQVWHTYSQHVRDEQIWRGRSQDCLRLCSMTKQYSHNIICSNVAFASTNRVGKLTRSSTDDPDLECAANELDWTYKIWALSIDLIERNHLLSRWDHLWSSYN